MACSTIFHHCPINRVRPMLMRPIFNLEELEKQLEIFKFSKNSSWVYLVGANAKLQIFFLLFCSLAFICKLSSNCVPTYKPYNLSFFTC
jgi:hypothetical protein